MIYSSVMEGKGNYIFTEGFLPFYISVEVSHDPGVSLWAAQAGKALLACNRFGYFQYLYSNLGNL